MNQWTDFNLPWSVDLMEETPPYPDVALSDRIKQAFGQTQEEAEAKMLLLLAPLEQYEVDEYLSDHLPGYDETWGEERITLLDTFLQQNPSLGLYPECQALLAYDRFRLQLRAWEEQQPEVLEWNRACDRQEAALREKEKRLSFCGAGLNLPGTLIEFEHEGELTQLLIGNINNLGGVCDDCRGLTNETIIKSFKVVYKLPHLEYPYWEPDGECPKGGKHNWMLDGHNAGDGICTKCLKRD